MKHKLYSVIKVALIIIGTGSALAVPFLRYNYGWLVCVSLLPLFFVLEWLEAVSWGVWRKAWMLYGTGLVFFGVIVQWMYHIHATDLIQDSSLRTIFIILTFFLVASSLSLGFLILGWLYFRLRLSLKKPSIVWLLPSIWMISEFARSVLFSILWLGPGGSVGSHWNFGVLGFGVSASPLGYAARLIGLYGLGGAVVLINLSIFLLMKRRHQWRAILGMALVLVIAGCGFLLYRSPSRPKKLRVGIVHLQSEADTDYEIDLQNSINQHSSARPQLLILPEYAHFFEAGSDESASRDKKIVTTVFRGQERSGVIITSRAGQGARAGENDVVYLDGTNKTLTTQEKQFLIPAGEYVPYVFQVILVLSGNGEVVSNHEATKTIKTGGSSEGPVMIDGVRLGALACSGAIAPELYRNLTRQGAEVLINSASLSSMGIDKLYFEQAMQMARFQAIANARPFIQSARGGQSYLITKDGSFVTQSEGDKTQYIETDLSSNAQRTVYSLVGEWLLLLSASALVARIYLTRIAKHSTIKRKSNT